MRTHWHKSMLALSLTISTVAGVDAKTIPGFQATGWAILVAPVHTSEAIIRKVSEELRKVVGQPELDKQLAALGSYTNPMSPTETIAFVHRQQQMWQPVLDEIAKKSQ